MVGEVEKYIRKAKIDDGGFEEVDKKMKEAILEEITKKAKKIEMYDDGDGGKYIVAEFARGRAIIPIDEMKVEIRGGFIITKSEVYAVVFRDEDGNEYEVDFE